MAAAILFGLLVGCACRPPPAALQRRSFDFQQDAFAYANDLVWEYGFDEHGEWKAKSRQSRPDYAHHCFVVARAAKQFYLNARFDPAQPPATEATYRFLVRRLVASSPRREVPDGRRILFPGYASLREFSRDHGALLKAECGSYWQSYFQRGNWRMIFPFSRAHQAEAARRLAEAVRRNRPAVIHLSSFPRLTINHAVLVYAVTESDQEMRFVTYDPNSPEQPTTLTFRHSTRTFTFPPNFYFPGGAVDVYEVYCSPCY